MPSNRLQEKFDYHAQDEKSDMWYHFNTLAATAKNSDSVVELGVRGIVSTWALLYGLAISNSRLIDHIDYKKLSITSVKTLISYDINDPSEYGGNIEEVYDIAQENDVNFSFKKANTLEIELDPCHTIFFDTDHTYEQLSQELKLHGNKASRYLMFHDTTELGKLIVPAINEFLEENSEWTVLKIENMCNGLVVLAKRSVEEIKQAVKHHSTLENNKK
tara:strand:- start:68 stop:721 length:654 start_codon:yes stop_codon:yes gene_type:complete